ncbi:hypothetical protein [Flindersiella endophytica]
MDEVAVVAYDVRELLGVDLDPAILVRDIDQVREWRLLHRAGAVAVVLSQHCQKHPFDETADTDKG